MGKSFVHQTKDYNWRDGLVVERVSSHRNGIGGAGFHVVMFLHHGNPSSRSSTPMVGVVFEERAHVAVFNRVLIGKGDGDFFTNSWRGDDYEDFLRNAVSSYNLAQQLLRTDKWATGWSPGTDPLPVSEAVVTTAEDREEFSNITGVPVAEIPEVLVQLQQAIAGVEQHGGTIYVFRDKDALTDVQTWKQVRDVFPENATLTSPRVFDVRGFDNKARKDRQAERDLLGVAMAAVMTGETRTPYRQFVERNGGGPAFKEPTPSPAARNLGKSVLTLDDLIATAVKARDESPLGGDTVVHLCEWEREYVPCRDTMLDVDEDGAVFLVKI